MFCVYVQYFAMLWYFFNEINKFVYLTKIGYGEYIMHL